MNLMVKTYIALNEEKGHMVIGWNFPVTVSIGRIFFIRVTNDTDGHAM
jgi:hypothetical protein